MIALMHGNHPARTTENAAVDATISRCARLRKAPPRSLRRYSVVWLALLLLSMRAEGVINPTLQPDVYYDRYENVLLLEVAGMQLDAATMTCRVVRVLKGTYERDDVIRVGLSDALAEQLAARAEDGALFAGYRLPAFAGTPSRRKSRRQVRVYMGEFFTGEVDQQGPGRWTLDFSTAEETDTEGRTINTLAGIYCGRTGELIRMLEEMAEDRDFYPRKAYVRFHPDELLDSLPGPVEGLALYDLNGDGMEDVVACSPAGDRVYFQLEPLQFVDVTAKLGLRTASASVSVADANCDGLSDLLLDMRLFRGTFNDNEFGLEETDWLPPGAGEEFKCAAFVELDGDGYPDVVISIAGGGLRAFRNPGPEGGAFADATSDYGLDQKDCGAGGDGFFAPGDWNGDRQADLFYGVGDGLLLVQENGRFKPVSHRVPFLFEMDLQIEGEIRRLPGLTGAGVFVDVLNTGRMDLVVPVDEDWRVVANEAGKLVDVTPWGNEISEGSDFHLATIAEDLNLDGYMDLYTICGGHNENRFIINRGYGSFMHAAPHVDDKPLFRGPAHGGGGRSVAAGDVNDDGSPDLLIGKEDGRLFMILNDTLSMRRDAPHLTKDEKRLLDVRLCSVRVLGPRGVVNARIRLLDQAGRVVARRDLTTNVATGCRGPDMATLAVRRPGRYTLRVDYADGHAQTRDIDLTRQRRLSIVIERDDGERDNDGW